LPSDRFAITSKGFAMSYSSFRVSCLALTIITAALIFSPVTGHSKPRLESTPCRIDLTQNQIDQTRETRICDDRKTSSLNTRTLNRGGGGSSGGGVSPLLPPELPGRLIVEQFFSVTYRMSVIGFSFGNSNPSSHSHSHHLSVINPLAAADVTYGIGIGVATNGETTLVAVGGAFAATVTSTNMTQASAVSSGQGLGITYAFTAPLPTPIAGEVIKVSQMFSVVVTNTVPIDTNTQTNTVKHDEKKNSPHTVTESPTPAPTKAVVATDQAILSVNATLGQNSSDALVSAVALTGSTTVIAGAGITPVTAHAVGTAGGAGLTTTQAPGSLVTPSSAGTTPIEINQTLTVKAETVIADTAKIPQQQNTADKKIEQPTQTVAASAVSSPVPPQNSSLTPVTTPPVHAETVAQGISTTDTKASSISNQSVDHVEKNKSTLSEQSHQGADQKKSADTKQNGEPSKDAHGKEQTHEMQKEKVTPASADPAKQTTSPSALEASVPNGNTAASSNLKNAPSTPSTAAATASATGGAATGSGTLAAGAGAEAQSNAQSAGPSKSAPAQAAASGDAAAGAGASSVSPSQTATASGVSLASTGATLQKSP